MVVWVCVFCSMVMVLVMGVLCNCCVSCRFSLIVIVLISVVIVVVLC